MLPDCPVGRIVNNLLCFPNAIYATIFNTRLQINLHKILGQKSETPVTQSTGLYTGGDRRTTEEEALKP